MTMLNTIYFASMVWRNWKVIFYFSLFNTDQFNSYVNCLLLKFITKSWIKLPFQKRKRLAWIDTTFVYWRISIIYSYIAAKVTRNWCYLYLLKDPHDRVAQYWMGRTCSDHTANKITFVLSQVHWGSLKISSHGGFNLRIASREPQDHKNILCRQKRKHMNHQQVSNELSIGKSFGHPCSDMFAAVNLYDWTIGGLPDKISTEIEDETPQIGFSPPLDIMLSNDAHRKKKEDAF